ncbi:uncharacterized protein LOC111294651 [Durio zibethinus]|uniref:Uncharacterized protein LOC111294651 n=2 Tax=Durio zibethinus TaxID=66656 RepID=A0A6P5YU40_DURZI|nr:uncharacterized protein LOC111294651 [Durio zibethinus]
MGKKKEHVVKDGAGSGPGGGAVFSFLCPFCLIATVSDYSVRSSSALMDPLGAVDEAILSVPEAELTKEREKTKLMKESARADQAALEAKERELAMLVRKKDRMLATKEAGDRLVDVFLEADGNNENFDETAMMDAILALIRDDGGDDGGDDVVDEGGDDSGDGGDGE